MVNRQVLCNTRRYEESKALRLENTGLRSMNLRLKTELDKLTISYVRLDYNKVPLPKERGVVQPRNDKEKVMQQLQPGPALVGDKGCDAPGQRF
ncbi:unnamed protein product [Cochlearia groenlandica]